MPSVFPPSRVRAFRIEHNPLRRQDPNVADHMKTGRHDMSSGGPAAEYARLLAEVRNLSRCVFFLLRTHVMPTRSQLPVACTPALADPEPQRDGLRLPRATPTCLERVISKLRRRSSRCSTSPAPDPCVHVLLEARVAHGCLLIFLAVLQSRHILALQSGQLPLNQSRRVACGVLEEGRIRVYHPCAFDIHRHFESPPLQHERLADDAPSACLDDALRSLLDRPLPTAIRDLEHLAPAPPRRVGAQTSEVEAASAVALGADGVLGIPLRSVHVDARIVPVYAYAPPRILLSVFRCYRHPFRFRAAARAPMCWDPDPVSKAAAAAATSRIHLALISEDFIDQRPRTRCLKAALHLWRSSSSLTFPPHDAPSAVFSSPPSAVVCAHREDDIARSAIFSSLDDGRARLDCALFKAQPRGLGQPRPLLSDVTGCCCHSPHPLLLAHTRGVDDVLELAQRGVLACASAPPRGLERPSLYASPTPLRRGARLPRVCGVLDKGIVELEVLLKLVDLSPLDQRCHCFCFEAALLACVALFAHEARVSVSALLRSTLVCSRELASLSIASALSRSTSAATCRVAALIPWWVWEGLRALGADGTMPSRPHSAAAICVHGQDDDDATRAARSGIPIVPGTSARKTSYPLSAPSSPFSTLVVLDDGVRALRAAIPFAPIQFVFVPLHERLVENEFPHYMCVV
ncbi:hypothetical protein C8R45DRAFT_1101791 [Mycena sanguinolenta]|nr:hypothetical protein C8R45DRAFT_1101791 [Mycena sanguinolenta]